MNKNTLEKLFKQIEKSDIVSFDIFDTLLERKILHPSDIFLMLDSYAFINHNINNFSEIRKNIKNITLKKSEELSLKERYISISKIHNINIDICFDIMNKELEIEESLLSVRKRGKILLDAANSLKKRIILISDTYFSSEFVEKILRVNDLYNMVDKTYLSSDVGLTKQTGKLFKHVKTLEKGVIFHIGDNKKSDIKNAQRCGFNSLHLPSSFELYHKNLPSFNSLKLIENPTARGVLSGLIINKLSSINADENDTSFSKNSAYFLGYHILGILFYNFTKWIEEISTQNNIEELFFLSRDGRIVKDTHNILFPEKKKNTHYLLASRRCCNISAIMCKEDIIQILDEKFYKSTLHDISIHKFGINEEFLQNMKVEEYGFKSIDEIVFYKKDRQRILEFLLSKTVLTHIINNSKQERLSYLNYLSEMGLNTKQDPSRFCFIDIGHAGTLQKSISDILSLKNTNGFYFVTNAKSKITLREHNKFSYLHKNLEASSSEHYQKNMLMYEFMFSNDEKSLVRFNNAGPEFLQESNDKERIAIINEIHRGVIDFVKDIKKLSDTFWLDIKLSPLLSTTLFQEFINSPSNEDVKLFQNISLENAYAGSFHRPVISKTKKEGFWKKGNWVLKNPKTNKLLYKLKLIIKKN
mgnify:CR=1 FL=1